MRKCVQGRWFESLIAGHGVEHLSGGVIEMVGVSRQFKLTLLRF